MYPYLLLMSTVFTAEPPAIHVAVTPRNGNVILGRVDAEFEMEATFGTVLFESHKISQISFGTPTVVTTTDSSVVRGQFKFEKLTIKTKDGPTTIRVSQLEKLVVMKKARQVPGMITSGRSSNGLTYHLRVPPKFDPAIATPTIIILHGSNMNSLDYVKSIASRWPEIAKRYIIVGINGEKRSQLSTPENPRFNYTYVNFVGQRSTFKGYPGTDRESPALVKELVEELRADLPIERLFIGGHSQGAFLTYTTFMHFPELFDGAFPISGGVIVQAEPTAFQHKGIRKAQRDRPIAIVHGTTDTNVRYSVAQNAIDAFHNDGFPRVRLFSHQTAGHRFIFLPVDKAIIWLEEMTSNDPVQLIANAAKKIKAQHYRDASALLARAETLRESNAREIANMRLKIDQAAQPSADKLATAITANKNGNWVDDFLEFRLQFEFCSAAEPVLQAYQQLRSQHQPKADELYRKSRTDLRARQIDDAYKRYQEVVEKYYASSHYAKMKRWLNERKK